MILLDTHALVWFFLASKSLGHRALRVIEHAASRKAARVSSLTFFELGRKVQRGQIKGLVDIDEFRLDVLAFGIGEVPPDGPIAVRASHFVNILPDAIDAMILATAEQRDLELCTADERILAWKGRVKRIDARK
jgi:PIN domain nuclease of toxin-antitoxin system